MGNPKSGGEDDITAKGKYLLISVPEFGEDPISGKQMTSYLRLGAASTTWEQDPGGYLVKDVHLAGPPGAHLTPAGTEVSPAGDSGDARPVFIDDTRDREGFAGLHGLSVAERQNESAALHTRGGWRDHSDGNRISTTYGDKVEVIRGNYKMVVLGRQDDDMSMSAGWDVSGQHIQDFAYTNPAFLRVEWTKDQSGVWHLQSTSEGVVTSEKFAGDSYEYKFGKRWETTVGSESPQPPSGTGDPATYVSSRENPEIIERTWAQKLESYTGSSGWRIPSIYDETWAVETTSLTDVSGDVTETTTVGGAITSTTTAGSVSETTTVSGTVTSTTTTGATTETTTSGAITGITTAGAITEVTTVGVKTGVTTAGAIVDVTLAANKTDVFVGLSTIDLKAAVLQFEATTGFKLEINATKKWVYTFFDDKELNSVKEANSLQNQLNALRSTVNALQVNTTAAMYSVQASIIDLGLGVGAVAAASMATTARLNAAGIP